MLNVKNSNIANNEMYTIYYYNRCANIREFVRSYSASKQINHNAYNMCIILLL